ncbi:nuclease-related domain-containing protein [Aureibaculum marinum]|nr:nuclease-related domain-containing protein [Aureibaculum marinum]
MGENLVVKEIMKLSDEYVLINDFNLSFSNPIFYKKYNQRIKSIQIDHLLISKAGIFIIETKNWSKSSINSLSLRSPVEQIERANFALYVYLSEHITLNEHHWGEQQIPIRNLIVMINNKPKANFKYVKIKLLKVMNDYIKYFEPVLTENQLNIVVNELI